jgi:acetyl/propionyl-CoA carboxylase alpha subunit
MVVAQLRVARGEPLGFSQADVRMDGHAIEVRLYAEDAAAGYLPQTGTIDRLEIPGAEPFAVPRGGADPADLRLDGGYESGTVVTPHYDPMLAKVIAWAPSRREAAARLAAALAAAAVQGLVTNRDLLVRVLRDPGFLAGETDTGFLERDPELLEPLVDAAGERLHAAAAALAAMAERRSRARVLRFAPPGFRNNFSEPQRIGFAGTSAEHEVTYALRRDGLELAVGGEPLAGATIRSLAPGAVELEVEGISRIYAVHRAGGVHHVNSPLGQSSLRELPRFPSGEEALGEGALAAPMPGKVIKLAVAEGAEVAAGDVLVVLEAMKMEHELTAPADGVVAELRVAEGDQVEAGAALAVIS